MLLVRRPMLLLRPFALWRLGNGDRRAQFYGDTASKQEQQHMNRSAGHFPDFVSFATRAEGPRAGAYGGPRGEERTVDSAATPTYVLLLI